MADDQTIPNTGDPKVDAAIARIRGKFTDMDDALIIQAHLEKENGEYLRQHARHIEEHQRHLNEHAAWVAEMRDRDRIHDEKIQGLDERISKLVSAMGAFIAQRPPV